MIRKSVGEGADVVGEFVDLLGVYLMEMAAEDAYPSVDLLLGVEAPLVVLEGDAGLRVSHRLLGGLTVIYIESV